MKRQFDVYKPNWKNYFKARKDLLLQGLVFSSLAALILQKLKPEPRIINLT